ncbi:MAG: hemin receptor [Prevotella sp.]|nr:hemin receptor [Prevotella sp.]
MKKIIMTAFVLAAVLPVAAQDTYESARLLGSDLNGTARYVAMGGAMEALGADISTMSTNPAGIGLFRHSTASLSFGLVSQQDAVRFDGLGKTNMSFDQVGFVYSSRISRASYVNVGFNYHKSRNFDQILSAANSLRGSSQNGLSYYKDGLGSSARGGYYLDFNQQDELIGWESPTSDYRAQTFSQVDYLNANVLLLNEWETEPGKYDWDLGFNDASSYTFDRAHRGWIADYDFNISGNHNDRFYWGITVGMKDVNYKGYSGYSEQLVDGQGACGSVAYGDERKIEGTGFDIKVGIIVRPVEESPFRFGLSVSTPTWYDLTTSNSTYMLNDSKYGAWDDGQSSEEYDFHYYTPWKFGLSIGHTVGTNLAIGAGYEYSDYSASQNRIIDGYDYYDNAESSTDEMMKGNTESVMKGVHTLKAGLEYKPDPSWALRLGYNYVSTAYDKSGVRDMTLDSPGVMYASTTDYVNWQDTHRVTCGVGYRSGGFSVDLAYQYNMTKGEFHPFQPYAGSNGMMEVDNKRHQLLLTLGYTF